MQYDTRIEVYVRVEFLSDEIVVFQRNMFQFERQFEQGAVFQLQFLQRGVAGANDRSDDADRRAQPSRSRSATSADTWYVSASVGKAPLRTSAAYRAIASVAAVPSSA